MLKTLFKQCSLTCVIVFFAAALSASEQYKAGMDAFRAGDYHQALQHFETARQQGQESPNLLYNLAVTHYKLRQYGEAKRYFTQLVEEHPEWSDLARYNLGLIALRQGNNREAEKRFRHVRRTSDNEKLIHLAGQGLRKLDITPAPTKREKKWFTLLSLGGGYDDNAIAFPDRLQTSASQGEDYFIEALAYGQVYLSGNAGDGVRLHGFGYTKQYDDLDIVDLNTFSAGISHEFTYNDWDLEYGAGAGYTEVDGDELTTQFQGQFKLGRTLGRNHYLASYRPVYHDGGGRFLHLEGWQHRLDLRWRHRVDDWRWTLRYRLEYNDRDDLTAGNTFLSYSPLRNGILVQGDWYAAPDWTLTAGAEYTNSHYHDENRMSDIDGLFKVQERDSDEIEAWVKVQYELARNWRVLAEYRYNKNSDNFLLYDYDRNEVKVAIEFTY